jgi:general secretion pathway protein F
MRYEVLVLTETGRSRILVDAAHADQAADLVRRQHRGMTVLAVRGRRRPGFAARRFRFPLILFGKELLALLASGLSLVEALQTLEEKESHPEAKAILGRILRSIHEGEPFSAAIAEQGEYFPPLFVATVRASEKTSNLQEGLSRYIAYEEQVEQARKKLIGASIYPLLLLVLGCLVALFLMTYVVPRFSLVYEGNMERLPLASRMLMEWGTFISGHAPELTVTAAVSGGAALGLLKVPRVQAAISRQFWRVPAIGSRLRIIQLARFFRTVGMLLSGGIAVVSALGMAEGLLNLNMRRKLRDAAGHIGEGQPISHALETAGLTTPVAARMLRVGEKSGRMGEMMESIAAFYDGEIARSLEWFARLFEPLLMLFIGLLIGGILVLLYIPIFDLAGSLN